MSFSLRRFVRLAAHVQMLPVLESGEETLVGGQAVMDGVMVRSLPKSPRCRASRKNIRSSSTLSSAA
jgi:hypothetical protein